MQEAILSQRTLVRSQQVWEGTVFKKISETSATPHITITECLGSLAVRGSEEQQIVLRVEDGGDGTALSQEGNAFTVDAQADCHLG